MALLRAAALFFAAIAAAAAGGAGDGDACAGDVCASDVSLLQTVSRALIKAHVSRAAELGRRPQVNSWSSSQSSSSSWERGADGRMHNQVREVQEEVSGDGHRSKAAGAAVACVDGRCKGAAAGPDRRTALGEAATLADRVSRGRRGIDTQTPSAKAFDMDEMDATLGREDAMFSNMQRGMQRDMQDMMRPMEGVMRPAEHMMRPAEQTMRPAGAPFMDILRRERGAAAANRTAGMRSESRSYSYSSEGGGDGAVEQRVECHESTCVETTKHYGGAGPAAGAKKPTLAEPVPPTGKPKDVPHIEIIQKE